MQENIQDRDEKRRTAKGDNSGARLHPDKHSRGIKHRKAMAAFIQTHKGSNHWTHKKPERVVKGSAQGNAKLTEAQVKQILREWDGHYGQLAELGRKYFVDYTTISGIVRRTAWRHICED